MPQLTWSESIADGDTYRPLDGWQYQYAPTGGIITVLHRATAVNLVANVTAGSDTLQEEAPVPAGGTAGNIPSSLDVPPLTDMVAAGDLLKINYRNNSGGAITVDGVIDFRPA